MARLVVWGARDADEAVHDAPDRAEEADEGTDRADRGQHARAARQTAAGIGDDALQPPAHALLQGVALGALADGELGRGAAGGGRRRHRAGRRGRAPPRSGCGHWARVVRPARARRLAPSSSKVLARATVQVSTEATARPHMTDCTTISACENMPQGERSCGSIARAALTGAPAGASPCAKAWAAAITSRPAGARIRVRRRLDMAVTFSDGPRRWRDGAGPDPRRRGRACAARWGRRRPKRAAQAGGDRRGQGNSCREDGDAAGHAMLWTATTSSAPAIPGAEAERRCATRNAFSSGTDVRRRGTWFRTSR